MASDLAPPPQQLPPRDEAESDAPPSAPSVLEATINGVSEPTIPHMEQSGLVKGGEVTANEDHIPVPPSDTAVPDPIPAGPAPVEQVESGIAPVADFLPKDAANMSHPTPPPDEPLLTGSADIDVEMVNGGSDLRKPMESELPPAPILAQPEQSLVRPRDDDEDDERVVKRTKVEDAAVDLPIGDVTLPDAPVVEQVVETVIEPVSEPAVQASIEPAVEPVVAQATETIVDVAPAPVAEPAGEPVIASAGEILNEPVANRSAETETTAAEEPIAEPPAPTLPLSEPVTVETQLPNVPTEPTESAPAVPAVSEAAKVETPILETPTESSAAVSAVPATEPASDGAKKPTYSTEPMTSLQKTALLDRVKNLKKTKNSMAFLKPVDYMALNIPAYPDIITNPMDLSTMEAKLKEGKYGSVQDFANDFDLIIGNARRFNGDAHPVTQAGFAMEAYFRRVMENVPSADQQAPVKADKRSPSIATEKPKREPRVVTQPTPTPAAPPREAFALQADGTPEIRRQSSTSNSRPARAIKPPQNRDIPYSKPKRKMYQLELRFCEHVLDEIRSPKYGATNHVFMYPVDPVALNIPNYRSVVKFPMDLSTMSQKLKSGQYANANEFKKDFDLIVENCMSFNPPGNPVRDLGIQFQRNFEELWDEKGAWERKNQPASNRASSASADEDSAAEVEEEEEDEEDAKSATIRALQKQLADMQNALSGLNSDKPAKAKKSKPSKTASKKSGGAMGAVPAKKAAAKPPAKPKKAKLVTYEEKQEISEAVGKMNEKQVGMLTEIITKNCAKYRDMEEMELEIDDLPNDVQVMLLEYVRKLFGNPNKKKAREASPDDAAALDDDDYEEKGGARGGSGKRKKHPPMGKKEQQETINSIKNKLAQFSQAATSGSESPTNSSFAANNAQVDTSGDEESEESEEE